jgi:hypothetical protein
MLTVGLPAEWKVFEERHRRFLELFPVVKDACNIAFKSVRIESLADAVVLGLGRVCGEEFLEILVLCGNGYGFAATRLLRSMYERAVTARYIHTHADDAERYVRYSTIQKGKLARVWLEQFRNRLPPAEVKRLERAVAEAREIRDDYLTACEKCGHERPSPSWGPDVVSMALDTQLLRAFLGTCYYEALLHAHATPHSVEAFVHKQDDGGWTFDFERPQRAQADNTLFHAHTILLDVLELQRERFSPGRLTAALDAALAAYRAIWKVPDAAPSEAPAR